MRKQNINRKPAANAQPNTTNTAALMQATPGDAPATSADQDATEQPEAEQPSPPPPPRWTRPPAPRPPSSPPPCRSCP